MLNGIIVVGTRPEAIKLLPVYLQFKAEKNVRVKLLSTGQHKEMVEPLYRFFGVRPDINLKIMNPGQTLSHITASVVTLFTDVLSNDRPDFVIVQGDTTSAMAAGLASFYLRIPVMHVEAGLRSYRMDAPFPEELNRRVISLFSTIHFAPTEASAKALRQENLPGAIRIVGNTVIDSLLVTRKRVRLNPLPYETKFSFLKKFQRMVLITAHRRENHGASLLKICGAIRKLATVHRDVSWVYPVHLNPAVHDIVYKELADLGNVFLIKPVRYDEMIFLMDKCTLIITDSGGVQEEAPSLNKPVVVLRSVTERTESIDAGYGALVGTSPKRIIAETNRLLAGDPSKRKFKNPYGDGKSSVRIVRQILRSLKH